MKIKIHYSLLLVLFLCLFTRLFLEFLIFFFIIMLHELGHITMALIFKQNIKKITLTALGGIVEIRFIRLNLFKQLLINASGIIVNVVLLILFKYLFTSPLQTIIINYNLILIFFNLLPIYPLDGYRIFSNCITLFLKPTHQYQVIIIISFIFLGFLLYYSISKFSAAFLIVSVFLLQKNIYLLLNKNYYILQKIIYSL